MRLLILLAEVYIKQHRFKEVLIVLFQLSGIFDWLIGHNVFN